MTAQGVSPIQVSMRRRNGDIAAAQDVRRSRRERSASGGPQKKNLQTPLFRNGAPPTVVMAGLDPAIHAQLTQFETLHGPPGQARG
jgi:hypothetical protein